jgi:N-acetylglutamate synthase-like GNAT family acetyltransferase
MPIRLARRKDVPAIHALIAECAERGLLLPRTEEDIRARIGQFIVLVHGNQLAGCVALDSYTADLAEIRSLAVHSEFQGSGNGQKLLAFAMQEARHRGISRVFAVTHVSGLFLHAGFSPGSRHEVPEKLERDCNQCSKRKSCRLVTVVAELLPGSEMFPILEDRGLAVLHA